MMELSMEFDLSLGKMLLGFAGVSVAVCAYKFHSSNNNEEVSCCDGEDIFSELNQSCCTEDKKVKSPETSNELVSNVEKRFVGRNKLLINPGKVKIPKPKPVFIRLEPKVSPALSCMDLNEVSEVKEVLEADSCLTKDENKNSKPVIIEDYTKIKNDVSTEVENENFTQDEKENFSRVKNNFIPINNEDFTQAENDSPMQVENKSSKNVENDNLSPVKTKNSAPVLNKDLNINNVSDEKFLTITFSGIFINQQTIFVVKYHMNELGKVLTQMENI